MEMYRQGGVLLIPVDEAPPGREAPREEDGRLALSTRGDEPFYWIVGGGATLILDEWWEFYLTVTDPEGVELVHEGRATVRVRPGSYRVARRYGHQYWPGKGRS